MALQARFAGRLSDPSSFVVNHRLDFVPPRTPIPAVERLKTDFVHEVEMPNGTRRAIDVSPSSPDFVPLGDVPPLFVRALLLAEDAGFFGHRGVDLSEITVALATDWARGSAARGASTLTQQLAKNLFLSRERSLGRKLQELALTLLLESALGKNRILEIYLNIIEWGPGIYGLRPAARHYFGKEPRDLSVKEMVFLVALIPGPVKYQRSFAAGELSPGFETLVTHLLNKLRSLEVLSEAEYEAAREEKLIFRRPEAPEP
jgi:membrane peptidoglycan carboxypeptidase